MWYDEITSLASQNVGNWKKDSKLEFRLGRLEDICNPQTQVIICYETWSSANGIEKTIMDEANETAILRELQQYMRGETPSITEYPITRENVLIVTAIDEYGNETPAWLTIIEIAESLSNYPVLDEDLYSQLEAEKNDEIINQLMNNPLCIDQLQDGLHEGLSKYSSDDYCEENVLKAGLQSWYDGLSEDTVSQIIDLIQTNDPKLIAPAIDKMNFVKNAISDLNRSDIEELQSLINSALELIVVR